jgi:hypothetical protein
LLINNRNEVLPQEYFDTPPEIPNNSSFELSEYLQNMVEFNLQLDRDNNGQAQEIEQPNDVDQREESQSAHQRSYQDNMEEGKSLIEDFRQRFLNEEGRFPLIPSNFQGDHEREIAPPRRMPTIPSEGSKMSASSDSNQLQFARRSQQADSLPESQRKIIESHGKSHFDRYRMVMNQSEEHKSLDGFDKISEIHLPSKEPSKLSSPHIRPHNNRIFKKEENTEFLEEVYPFQEDFSQDNAFGNVLNFRKMKTDKNLKKSDQENIA